MSSYNDEFYEYLRLCAIRSAKAVLPYLTNELSLNNVLDVGCGQGAWLSIWKELGVANISGIDGDYVKRDNLLIEPGSFIAHDLSNKFDLQRRFDLVQSLEVAEHLPETSSEGFVESLVNHGDLILFSASPKGQGGDTHVNEQSYEYWRALFAQHNYKAIDYIRPLISENTIIEPWYRYNTFIYVSDEYFDQLPQAIQNCLVPENEKLKDISPLWYKIRKSLIRFMPIPLMRRAAKVKGFFIRLIRRKSQLPSE